MLRSNPFIRLRCESPVPLRSHKIISVLSVLFFLLPLCWPPLFLAFSDLFCRAKGTAQSLQRGSFRMDLSRKFGKKFLPEICAKKVRNHFCDDFPFFSSGFGTANRPSINNFEAADRPNTKDKARLHLANSKSP